MSAANTGTAPPDGLPPVTFALVDDKNNTKHSTSIRNEEPTPEVNIRPEREPTFKDYLRVFSYATKWDIFAYFAAGLASIAAGTTLPLMNIVFGQLISQFNAFGATTTADDFKRVADRQALYLFILFLARWILNYINKFGFRMIGIRLSAAIRLHYLQRLFGQTIHVLDSMPAGAAAATITSTANTLQIGISEKLGVFLEFNGTIWTAIIVAFIYSWSLTLVTASVILFILFVLAVLLPFVIKGHTQMTKAEGKASAVASEAFSSIRIITACGAENRVAARYAHWVTVARQKGQSTAPLIALQFGLVFFALFGAFGLAFWYGTHSWVDGRVDNVGEVIIVLMSVMLVVMSLERISTPLLAISKAMVAACEFLTVIDAPRPRTGELKDTQVSANQNIEFKGVTFAYPSRPHVKVLDGLDLTIEAGKVTAIVGPSGSGKSTIVGLIERWYTLQDQHVIAKTIEKDKTKGAQKTKGKKKVRDDSDEEETSKPEEAGAAVELKGSITTSGHALDDIELKWWRSQIGLVQQEPFLFNDTIFNNVAYGLIGSQWEDEPEEKKRELVKEACQESFADEFIDRLPDGYDTQVGDSGAKLSGGQRQRIAIARSIVRKPKIVILDEATSAIDVRGERIVQAALDKVSKNRTTITIAHRLSTIKQADRIVVLKKGKVVEQGTHESLLEDDEGVYYGLVHAQQLSLGDQTEDNNNDNKEEELDAVLAREKSATRVEVDSTRQKTEATNRNIFQSFGLLLYEQRDRWLLCILTVVFAACCAAGTPLQAWLFAKVIVVFNPENSPDKIRSDSNFWSLMWAVLAIGVGLSYFFMGFVSTHLSHFICAAYRQQYFEAILFQKTSFYDEEENAHGSLTARVAGDPKQLEELLGINMAMVYTAIFNIIGTLIIAFAFGWKIALVALCVTMPISILAGYLRFKYEIEFDKMNAAVFVESSKFAAESIGAFRTVSALTLEDTTCSRYEDLLKSHVNHAFKKARWNSFVFGFSDSVSLACQALIFWYGSRLLASGEYSPQTFFISFMAVFQGAEAAGQGLSFGPNAAQVTGASNRILNMRKSRNQDLIPATEKIPDADGGVQIELRDIHFKYPTRDVSVFKGLSLTVEKGQFAALVGASGCGKTSIVSLMERFYDVQKGAILCNGKNINDVNVYEYRKQLSLVAQEPTLFQGTIRENILLGVDDKAVTDEQLHQVCRDASIHDFIISLPEGYSTDIGSKGVSLSGGQKQRVAIARALIRNPNILLLDEATSSLDSESEKLVQAAFEKAGKGRTMLVVAHRLATVQNADVIFVLGEGKLLEKGSHSELLKKKGVYWHMCHSQALDR
ncbi:ABC transporter transmembrane region [Colletotrichum higginsianum]|uniref:Leptomycin B resistance protein pmd1 n=1 Tax=Colletotrichum higginsianum TaxID=80884 RepID=A0A4T0WES8_9PEZI|nr:Leptomycin B resistance protein pmd1 [Colletotrichum higginsianum]GJC92408.1 ABC transporter transmembrane region [Colletotrichum higginsianum]